MVLEMGMIWALVEDGWNPGKSSHPNFSQVWMNLPLGKVG